MAEPPAKKTRLETLQSLLEKFQSFDHKSNFCHAYRTLCYERLCGLISLEIDICDAAAVQPFSKALCRTSAVLDELYPFGSIFREGVDILNNITENENYKPEDGIVQELIEPLLLYLYDKNSHDCLRKLLEETPNETQLMITLTRHFFSKLSVSKSYTMDKYATRKESGCICMECKTADLVFDDTSIGNHKVWHGSLDIILGSCGISVTPEESDSPEAPAEVRFSDLNTLSVRDQALAQTITFSFLQHQRHPSMGHSLFPCILVSDKMIQYFFYDSENDILIQNLPAPLLHWDIKAKKYLPNFEAVITAWLVLNYRYLCSGPTENLLKAPKAGFNKFAAPVLDVYKSMLKFRNVQPSNNSDSAKYNPSNMFIKGYCKNIPFEWPGGDFPQPPSPCP